MKLLKGAKGKACLAKIWEINYAICEHIRHVAATAEALRNGWPLQFSPLALALHVTSLRFYLLQVAANPELSPMWWKIKDILPHAQVAEIYATNAASPALIPVFEVICGG